MDTIVTEFVQAMSLHGIVPTEPILATGQIQRFHIEGDTSQKKNGWAVLHNGPFPTGVFGNWKTGEKIKWFHHKPITPREQKEFAATMKHLQQEIMKTRKREQTEAARKARDLIDNSDPADSNHPYLIEKQITSHGKIYQQYETLLIPMFDGIALASVQAIYKNGSKQFLKGGKTKGCHLKLSSIENPDSVIVCEGFATAATLQSANPGSIVVAAFTASNLALVAQSMKMLYPVSIVVAADNDQWTEGNPGLDQGRRAAALVGGELIYPDFTGMDTSNRPTDFNDYFRLRGML